MFTEFKTLSGRVEEDDRNYYEDDPNTRIQRTGFKAMYEFSTNFVDLGKYIYVCVSRLLFLDRSLFSGSFSHSPYVHVLIIVPYLEMCQTYHLLEEMKCGQPLCNCKNNT